MEGKIKHSVKDSQSLLVVLGGGESGVGAVLLGQHVGYRVFLSDKGEIAKEYKDILEQNEVEYEENVHTEAKILSADVVVKSPGIPDTVDIVTKLNAKGIPVISEIEFAYQLKPSDYVAITGSNGKTTTTLLTYNLLRAGGLNVGIAGNIGDSLAKQLVKNSFDTYVLELSSFQLDGIDQFRPKIAMILNLSPDHLDRYDNDYSKYIDAKFNIIKNQTENDFLIYDYDDQEINKWLIKHQTSSKLVPFSLKEELQFGAFVKEDNIIVRVTEQDLKMNTTTLKIKGEHNKKNAMASMLAAKLLQVRNKNIVDSMSQFEGVEHRLEQVLKIGGVQYINDSKATNVNSAFYALECVNQPIVWIVGGVDKGNDYTDLMPLVREKVKAIVCLGLDNSKIISTFGKVMSTIVETAGAEEAVKVANKIAEKGDAVLLSPACASFDLFENYEDRGNKFKMAVRNL